MTDRIRNVAAQLSKKLCTDHNEEVFTIVADAFRDVTCASRVIVYLVNSHLDSIVIMEDTSECHLGASFSLTSDEYPCRILRQYSTIYSEAGKILGHPLQDESEGYLGIPLLFKNQSFGIIEVFEPEDTYLKNSDTLEALSFPVSMALRSIQITTELRKQSEVVDAINKIAKIVSSSLRIEAFYEDFANEVKKLVDFDRISIALADTEKENLKIYAVSATNLNTKLGRGVILPLAGTAPGWVIKNKKPIIVKDLQQEKVFIEDERLVSEGIRSAIRLPLVINASVLATLQLNSCKVGLYGERELGILRKVADRIAEAIENTILFNRIETVNQQLKQQNIRLETINAVTLAINESLEPEVVLQKALSTVLEVTGWDCGDILIWDDMNKFLSMVVHQGLSENFVSQWKIQKRGTLAYKTAVTGETISISRLNDSPEQDYLRREGIVSATHIPLYSKHKLVGVMPIATRKVVSQPPDQELLNSIGNQIGVAIENAKLYQQIRELAEKDSLTGLWNRRKFFEFMELEAIRSRRYNKGFALLMIDVDNFKKFNDTFGHLKGDEVLAETARVIQKTIRESDYAGRLGGEEFAVIALQSSDGAWNLAERIRSHMENEGLSKPFPTVSIGLSIFPEDGTSIRELFTAADSALYAAKNAGRNKTLMFEEVNSNRQNSV